MQTKIPVAILGATGSVGQKFIELLNNHPWFEIAELAASERSAGKKFKDSANWIMATELNNKYANMIIKKTNTELNSKLVFSAMDAAVAGPIEENLARNGYFVVSNARNHRFDKDVPLLIPEVNYEHLDVLKYQNYNGAIITNPNCSTIGLTIALKPLFDKFGLKDVNVVTMQALSGGGYPGVSSMDILDNVVPFIGGEEAKLESEPAKILGTLFEKDFVDAKINISAQCNRVGVIDGHLETVQVNLEKSPSIEEIIAAFVNFKSKPQELDLPSAPKQPIHYFYEDRFPQPRLHRNIENGMAVSIGRLRKDKLFDYKFIVLSHNTARGAAGGTILCAELLKARGYLDKL